MALYPQHGRHYTPIICESDLFGKRMFPTQVGEKYSTS
jgi:hypothetical protein